MLFAFHKIKKFILPIFSIKKEHWERPTIRYFEIEQNRLRNFIDSVAKMHTSALGEDLSDYSNVDSQDLLQNTGQNSDSEESIGDDIEKMNI